MANFFTRTRGRQHGSKRLHWTDWMSYAYLLMGLLVMFGPVLWLVMSSFKTESALSQFPPSFLPYSQKEVVVAGHGDAVAFLHLGGGCGHGFVLRQGGAGRQGTQGQGGDGGEVGVALGHESAPVERLKGEPEPRGVRAVLRSSVPTVCRLQCVAHGFENIFLHRAVTIPFLRTNTSRTFHANQ